VVATVARAEAEAVGIVDMGDVVDAADTV